MTNEQRRLALAKARRKALEYAEAADRFPILSVGEDGPEVDPYKLGRREHIMKLADMWAHVAQSMKTGGALESDGVIPEPVIDDATI